MTRKRRFAIFGLGQFGEALARELAGLGCEVLAVDASPKKVDAIRDHVALAAAADIRDREAVRELFGHAFDHVVIAIGGSLEAPILATIHLKELGVKEIWVEASTDERAVALERVGATKILRPESDMGRRVAQSMANPNLIEFLPLTEGHGVVEVAAPSWTHGKTLAQLDLRREMNLAVIAIRSPDGDHIVVPGGDAQLDHKCILTLVGRDEDLTKFQERQ